MLIEKHNWSNELNQFYLFPNHHPIILFHLELIKTSKQYKKSETSNRLQPALESLKAITERHEIQKEQKHVDFQRQPSTTQQNDSHWTERQ